MSSKKNYYAVRTGRQPPQCELQVKGFAGAKFKGFATLSEAEDFLGGDHLTAPPIVPAAAYDEEYLLNYAATNGSYAPVRSHPPSHFSSHHSHHSKPYDKPQPYSHHHHSHSHHHHKYPSKRDYSSSSSARAPSYQQPQQQQPVYAQAVSAHPINLSPPAYFSDGAEDYDDAPPSYSQSNAQESSSYSAPAPSHSVPTFSATLFTDGASRGNPGVAGIGGVLLSNTGKTLYEFSAYIGSDRTNNEAEYEALIYGLRVAQAVGVTDLTVKADSKLVVGHLSENWKVNVPHLLPLVTLARALLATFRSWKMIHVLRHENSHADALSNRGADARAYSSGMAKLQRLQSIADIPLLPNEHEAEEESVLTPSYTPASNEVLPHARR